LNENRSLRIFLPPGYQEINTYPVIYCQDGEEFFNFGRIVTHAVKLILDEGIEPMIIVGVEVDIAERTDEYAPEGSRFADYCQFFANELIPFIDDRFATRPEAASRIIAGDSLGGTVSLHIALKSPKLFHNIISLSGAFFHSTQEEMMKQSDLSWLSMYMLVGLEEIAVKTDRGVFDFLEANRKSRRLLEERHAKVEYIEITGKHIWGFWQNELPDALRYFYRS
jgi:enterochelin esterase-like enzyme